MDGWLRIGTKIDTKDFDSQIEYIEQQMQEIEYKLKQADMGFEVGDTVKLQAQYEKLGNSLATLKQKQADLNKTDISNFEKQIKSAGKETTNVIKKMGKWALGIFAVESAYGFVRQTISTLTNYNSQLAKDVEYIRYSLAVSLEPLIEKIVSWVYKILQYVNYISMEWFGINLFANASADAINKTTQNAKELKKQLAGFDEMNVIGNNSNNNSNSIMPSTDLSKQQIEIPNWLKKITEGLEGIAKFAVEHPELIIGILGGTKLISFIASIIGGAGGTAGLLGIATALSIIAGISIKKVTDEIKDLNVSLKNNTKMTKSSLKNSEEFKESMEDVVVETGILISGLTKFKDITMEVAIAQAESATEIGAGRKALSLFTGEVIEHKEQLKNMLSEEKNYFNALETAYYSTNRNVEETKLYIEYLENYRQGLVKVTNTLENSNNTSGDYLDIIRENKIEISEIDMKINKLNNTLFANSNEFQKLSNEAGISNKTLSTTKQLIDGFKSKTVKLTIDAETSKAQSAIKNIFNGVSGTVNGIFDKLGLNIKIPKLASGGIINMPGRGVPLGIGGEAGREGVIPLTDSQAMEELGSAIGRYITVNLTNVTNFDGRTMARQQNKVQANKNFLMNR